MKKISILEQFASDAINAPAVITGGGGNCCKVTKVKTVKCKSSSKKTKVKCGSKSKKSGKSGGGCTPTPPPCY